MNAEVLAQTIVFLPSDELRNSITLGHGFTGLARVELALRAEGRLVWLLGVLRNPMYGPDPIYLISCAEEFDLRSDSRITTRFIDHLTPGQIMNVHNNMGLVPFENRLEIEKWMGPRIQEVPATGALGTKTISHYKNSSLKDKVLRNITG